jgi:hypothetical protein
VQRGAGAWELVMSVVRSGFHEGWSAMSCSHRRRGANLVVRLAGLLVLPVGLQTAEDGGW